MGVLHDEAHLYLLCLKSQQQMWTTKLEVRM